MDLKVAILLVLASCLSSGSAQTLNCYSCTDVIDETFTEGQPPTKSCTQLADQTTVPNNWACQTTYTSLGAGKTQITRGPVASNQTTRCDATAGTCYCTTDKCNGVTVKTPSTLSCYLCDSSDFFDNGCGAVVDPTSAYVRQEKGCSACGKTVSYNGYRTTYSRGCSRSVNTDAWCGVLGTGTYCVCKGNLCNSALPLQTLGVLTPLLISLFAIKSSY